MNFDLMQIAYIIYQYWFQLISVDYDAFYGYT